MPEPLERRTLGRGEVFHLDNPERAWLIDKGRVEVFAAPEGRRRHLFTMEAGDVLFGLDIDRPLAAIGATTAELLAIRRDAALAVSSISRWIRALGRAIAAEHGASKIAEPSPGGDLLRVDAGTIIGSESGDGLSWVVALSGEAELLDRYPLDRLFPLPPGTWARASSDLVLAAVDTFTLLQVDPLAEALDRFQRIALSWIQEREVGRRRDEVESAERREHADRARFAASLARLAGMVHGDVALSSRAESGPIERAVLLVLGAARIEIPSSVYEIARSSHLADMPPRNSDGSLWTRAFESAVGRLLRLGGVQKRWVGLKGEWWKTESGPLIGATKSRRIVALLPSRRMRDGSRYEEVDVESGQHAQLNDARAMALLPFGFTVYRPLPDRPLSVSSLLPFAFAGTGQDLLFLVLCGTLIGLFGSAPAFISRPLFDAVIPNGEKGQLLLCCAALLIAALSSALIGLGRSLATLRIEQRTSGAIQAAIWDRLLKLPVAFFRRYSAGDLAARANGIERIRRALAQSAVTLLMSGVTLLVSAAVMAWSDLRITLAALMVACVASVISVILLARIHPAVADSARHAGHTAGLTLQLLTGIGKLRASGAERRAFAAFSDRFALQHRAQLRERGLIRGIGTFHRVLPLAATAAIVIAISNTSMASVGTGALLGFLIAFGTFLAALGQILDAALRIVQVVPWAARVAPILAAAREVSEPSGAPIVLRGEIEVTRLGFRYGDEGPPVLDDVSFRARPGELIAFVGPSGSGKSTLLRLLLGFEKPTRGAVFYDGQDLARLDGDEVRRQLGVVLQGGEVLDATILENIGGGVRLPRADAMEAARIAVLDEDLARMPLGLHTRLALGGDSLSGGQRQRLVLARAVARRPKILLLDEATSALDNSTQARVRRNLASLAATRIVIAHRLSTVQDADRIYVLERGRIVQSGRFAQLMAEPGLFAELVRRQLD